mgnify:CR=1 FL=1
MQERWPQVHFRRSWKWLTALDDFRNWLIREVA